MMRALAVLLAMWFAAAEAAAPESAARVLADAYTTNPNLAAAGAQLRVVDEQVASALAQKRPAVGLVGAVGALSEQTASFVGSGQPLYRDYFLYGSKLAELDAGQTLYRGGALDAFLAAALANVAAQQAAVAALEQQVLLAAGQADAALYQVQRVIALEADEIDNLAREVAADRAALARQDLTIADVASAEKRLGDARVAHRQALAQQARARDAFVAVVGRAPLAPAEPFLKLELPQSEAETVRRALADAPDVLAASLQLDAARADRDGAFAALLPSLGISGLLHYENHATSGIITLHRASIALNMTIPIYAGGRTGAAVAGADAGIDQLAASLQAARDGAAAQAVAAWQSWQAAVQSMGPLRAAVGAAEQSLAGVRHERALGLRTSLEVLNADQALLNSRLILVQSETVVFDAGLSLQAAVGRLTARDLHLPVALRDTAEHLASMRTRWLDHFGAP